MLQAPLKDLSHGTEDGGEVAKSLSDLRIEVEKLDPSGLDTEAGWFTRFLGKIPGVGTPAQALLHALRELADADRLDRAVAREGSRPAQA